MKIFAIFIIFSSVLLSNNFIVEANIFNDVARSSVNIAMGVAKKVPDAIPRPDAIFSASKNLLGGYPFEIAFKAINVFCKYLWLWNWFRSQLTNDIRGEHTFF